MNPAEPDRRAAPSPQAPRTDAPTRPAPAAEKPAQPAVGSLLGKYRLVRALGKGAMGAVFEAEDTLIKRRVAIKVLLPAVAQDAEAVKRFLAEARAAAKLEHPNTVAVLTAGREGDTYFLVMELIRGGSASDYLKARGSFNWSEATRVIADACRGVAAAHAAGLVHRDIKPANIMRSLDGMVKVADFGLAKSVERTGDTITMTGGVVGTPEFMSPEQCRGERVDARTDVYSLGATYFALLTGKPPFAGTKSAIELLYAHCTAPVPDPRRAVPDLPEACTAVISKAMAKEPAERHADAQALLAELEALLKKHAAPAATDGSTWGELLAAVKTASRSTAGKSAPTRRAAPVPPTTAPAARPPESGRPAGRRLTPQVAFAASFALAAVVIAVFAAVGSLRNRGPSTPSGTSVGAPSDSSGSVKSGVGGVAPPPARDGGGDKTPTPSDKAAPDKDGLRPPEKKDPTVRRPVVIDMMPLIDVPRDAVFGTWEKAEGALKCGSERFATLELPYHPPAEYDFRIVFSRVEGNDHVQQILAVGGSRFAWEMGGWDNTNFGLGHIRHPNPKKTNTKSNATARPRAPALVNGRKYDSTVEIRRDRVRALLDGEVLCDYVADYRDFFVPQAWKRRDTRALGLASNSGITVFHTIEVVEVQGRGLFLRPEDPAVRRAELKRAGD